MKHTKILWKKSLLLLGMLKIGFVFNSLSSQNLMAYKDISDKKVNLPINFIKCVNTLSLGYQKGLKPKYINGICQRTNVLPTCNISNQYNIVHFNRLNPEASSNKRKVLVVSTFHGDEPESFHFTMQWIIKLIKSQKLGERFSWRIVPLVNPEGLKLGTRMNGNRIDLNRNFPTNQWDRDAITYWKEKRKKDPRRFPGWKAGSEKEVKCVISHIEDFRPNFVIAVHTPYGLLDMDGPLLSHNYPSYRGFPWKKLGTKTGSLGRYLWNDRGIPVLTIELPHTSVGYSTMQRMFSFTDEVIEKTLHYMNSSQY